jgi:hypothetical protein
MNIIKYTDKPDEAYRFEPADTRKIPEHVMRQAVMDVRKNKPKEEAIRK